MTIPPIAGPYLAAVVLLGGAGLAKVVRPHDTAVAVGRAGLGLALTRTEKLVRAGAIVELAVAVAAIVTSGPVAPLLVAASYLAFAAFVTAALAWRWPIASCGCFGRPDTRPTTAHVVVNAAAAVVALWWAGTSHHPVVTSLDHQPGHGIPLLLGTAVCALLAYLVLTNPLTQARRLS